MHSACVLNVSFTTSGSLPVLVIRMIAQLSSFIQSFPSTVSLYAFTS